MAQRTEITATITIEAVTADYEELDAVVEDVHEQIGALIAGNDWTGSVEVSLVTFDR